MSGSGTSATAVNTETSLLGEITLNLSLDELKNYISVGSIMAEMSSISAKSQHNISFFYLNLSQDELKNYISVSSIMAEKG